MERVKMYANKIEEHQKIMNDSLNEIINCENEIRKIIDPVEIDDDFIDNGFKGLVFVKGKKDETFQIISKFFKESKFQYETNTGTCCYYVRLKDTENMEKNNEDTL